MTSVTLTWSIGRPSDVQKTLDADIVSALDDRGINKAWLFPEQLLAAHKRIVNVALELAGAQTLQRMAAEMDARAHLSQGPRRTRFKADMAQNGLKQALRNRDETFGAGMVKIHWAAD